MKKLILKDWADQNWTFIGYQADEFVLSVYLEDAPMSVFFGEDYQDCLEQAERFYPVLKGEV